MASPVDRVIILLRQVDDDGLSLEGELPPGVFELDDDIRLESEWPLRYRLYACIVDGALAVTGRIECRFRMACDRCLAWRESDFSGNVTIVIEDVDVEEVDITDDLREEALLLLPQRFLCNPDPRKCQNDIVLIENPEEESAKTATRLWSKLDDLQL